MVDLAAALAHPLDALAAGEIRTAVDVVRSSGRVSDAVLFAAVTLEEPGREVVAAHRPGDPVDRQVRLIILPGPEASVVEVVVSLTTGQIMSWTPRDGVRPALLFDDSYRAILAVRADPEWQEAMRRRGITDFERVQIDPWPTGQFRQCARGEPAGRTVPLVLPGRALRQRLRPPGGRCAGHGGCGSGRGPATSKTSAWCPFPPAGEATSPRTTSRSAPACSPWRSSSRPARASPSRATCSPGRDGPCGWPWSPSRAWSCAASDTRTVGASDPSSTAPPSTRWSSPTATRVRCTDGRTPSTSESGASVAWPIRSRWAVTASARSRYLDAVFSSEHGTPYVIENAVCIHEEDYGILWKHNDMNAGRTEVRRSRRLVVSSIATVGNYEYGFYWYFYLDGTIQHEVKLTGIMSTQALRPDEQPAFGGGGGGRTGGPVPPAPVLRPTRHGGGRSGQRGPRGQCRKGARPGRTIRGATPSASVPSGSRPSGRPSGRSMRPAGRHWRFVNPASANGLDRPVAYKLVPGPTPTLLAQPDSSVGQRAGFARHNLWVTPFAPSERRAAGDYPNQHAGGDGLPRWTQADRSLLGAEMVVWHTFGVTHLSPARGLAGHAGRVLRVPPRSGGVLRLGIRPSTSLLPSTATDPGASAPPAPIGPPGAAQVEGPLAPRR